MRDLYIVVESNDIDINQLLPLLNSFQYPDCKINFSAVKPLQFQEPESVPYYKSMPVYAISTYCYFGESGPNKLVEDFDELRLVAEQFDIFIKELLAQDVRFREWVFKQDSEFETARTVNQFNLSKQRQKWALGDVLSDSAQMLRQFKSSFISPSYQPTLFSFESAKDRYNRKAAVEFIAGGVVGLLSISLFLLEPVTASILALAAVILIFAALYNLSKAKQFDEYHHNNATESLIASS
ncbi:hypothetical protein [Legionella micdadei]|uniref:Uncharacterized protein n=1 Tax=Legionella micdadei TaxID=451 RepID=A0A098GFM0_LEGMI|nr:hypothetical protein [Legionella micdadei]ARG97263.1 hypothetical protein B6N58_06085 [Legionella micdadei]ARH00432.1 hypothetical protein B6V88_08345 [Legionella micdadei]KTD28138.1 hypothetical protein Lmic_1249 [Legionella micdadei]NSL16768.1 hypothetical protein [Legionella micdadei]CEG61279.1 protein of unknown function [Legionella micdadei]